MKSERSDVSNTTDGGHKFERYGEVKVFLLISRNELVYVLLYILLHSGGFKTVSSVCFWITTDIVVTLIILLLHVKSVRDLSVFDTNVFLTSAIGEDVITIFQKMTNGRRVNCIK